jgi:hypothetical protein
MAAGALEERRNFLSRECIQPVCYLDLCGSASLYLVIDTTSV